MNLGMSDQKQRELDSSELDYTGKVLVLSPNTLKEEYRSPGESTLAGGKWLWVQPDQTRLPILCTCLGDGEIKNTLEPERFCRCTER